MPKHTNYACVTCIQIENPNHTPYWPAQGWLAKYYSPPSNQRETNSFWEWKWTFYWAQSIGFQNSVILVLKVIHLITYFTVWLCEHQYALHGAQDFIIKIHSIWPEEINSLVWQLLFCSRYFLKSIYLLLRKVLVKVVNILQQGDRFWFIHILSCRFNPIRSQLETVLNFWLVNVCLKEYEFIKGGHSFGLLSVIPNHEAAK